MAGFFCAWRIENCFKGVFQRNSVEPKKVREPIKVLHAAGFKQIPGAGKGSHRKFVHERYSGGVTLSGAEGADAKIYQEKQIKIAIERISP